MGVAAAGAEEALRLELEEADARNFVAACLLHDIGHYPLSHAAESAFVRSLGANHHEVSRWIILGTGEIEYTSSLAPLLADCKVDPEAVWSIIDDSGERPLLRSLAKLLKAPINLDTLDGIHRAARDFRIRKPRAPGPIFRWIDGEIGGEIGIEAEALGVVDAFWDLKDRVYDRIINLPSNILAEARLCELVAASFDRGLFKYFDRFDDACFARELGSRFEAIGLQHKEDEDYELRGHAAWGADLGAHAQALSGEHGSARRGTGPGLSALARTLPTRA